MSPYTLAVLLSIAGALCLALMAVAARRWPGGGPWAGSSKGDAQDEARGAQQTYVRQLILREMLRRRLYARFGELPLAVVKRIQSGDPEWCEILMARAKAAHSLDELDLE